MKCYEFFSMKLLNTIYFEIIVIKEAFQLKLCIVTFQNDIQIKKSLHDGKLLHAIDFEIVYKMCALKNEKTCIAKWI